MAKIEGRAQITGYITICLSEQEAGALDALVGYGTDPFLKVFYEKMGEAYLKKYEAGLRSLFESVRSGEGSVSSFLSKLQESRQVFTGQRISKALPSPPEAKQEGK